MDNIESELSQLITRIRQRDDAAAAELVAKYESLIRREIRMRLLDPRLQRVLDSGDICQSVLASFFVRAASGQFDLDDPNRLIGLLMTMARNKVAAAARRHHRQRRDSRRTEDMAEGVEHADQSLSSPSQIVAYNEILQRIDAELNAEEREVMMLRREGASWHQIAQQLGGTADGRRMQLTRAGDRVCKLLGIANS